MQHNLFLDPVPNQTQGINTIPIINHETHHISETETIHIIEIEVIRTIEIRITRTTDQEITHITDQTITDQIIIIKTDHGIIHKIEIQVIIIDIEIILNHRREIITIMIILNIEYILNRDSTPKHQRQIHQVQSNKETTSDPPGIDDTGNNELQLNQMNCESSDTESDTENTISINMMAVKNDYELIIYEQPLTSHIYEKQLELLHNYYIEPINSTQTAQDINEINTVSKPNKNDKIKRLNTNHIYQNIQKEQPKEKIWTIPFL